MSIAPVAYAATPTCFGKAATKVGTPGSDVIKGTSGNDVIVAKGGDDVILGKGGHDLICGNGGEDFIRGDAGNDKLNGGAGQDKVYYNSSSKGVTVNLATGRASGGGGSDVLKGFEDIVGSLSGDNLTGDNKKGGNLISGLDGDDVINGGSGVDILEGGVGSDAIDGGRAADGTAESNIVWYESSFATDGPTGPVTADLSQGTEVDPDGTDTLTNIDGLVGSKYADRLTGGDGDNFILGQAGDDVIDGGGGFDLSIYWFAGGAVTANLQTGTSSGGDGNDTLANIEGLYGTIEFGDNLVGDGRNNYIDGDAGDDTIDGGAGDDWLVGGDGRDQITGGANSGQSYDIVDYESNFSGPITADLQAGTVSGSGNDGSATDDAVTGVEGVYGTLFDDTLTGDAGANDLFGWYGNDTISGAAGNDALDGGTGYFDVNFNLQESGDVDTVDGGDGTDSCSTSESPTACESTVAPPSHPLSADAQATQTFRLSF